MQDHDIFNGAAALAYFLLLSIFPAAIFLISLVPYLSIPHLQQAIMDLLHQVLPQQSANLFEGTVLWLYLSGTALLIGSEINSLLAKNIRK
jgi:membrane protein